MIRDDPAAQTLSSAEEAEDTLKERKIKSIKDKKDKTNKKSRKEKPKSSFESDGVRSDDEDEVPPSPPPHKRKTKKSKDQDSYESISLPKSSDSGENNNDESSKAVAASTKKKSKKSKELQEGVDTTAGDSTAKSESEEEGAKTPNRKSRKKTKDGGGGYSSEDGGGKSDDEDYTPMIDKSSNKKKSKKSKTTNQSTKEASLDGLVSSESDHDAKIIDATERSTADKPSSTSKKKGKKQKEQSEPSSDHPKEKETSAEAESRITQTIPSIEKSSSKDKGDRDSETRDQKKDSTTKSKKSDKGKSSAVVSGGPLSKEETVEALPEEESFYARDDEASAKTLPRKNTSKKSIDVESADTLNKSATEEDGDPASKTPKESSKMKTKRRSSKDGNSAEGKLSSSTKSNEEGSSNKSKAKRRPSSDGIAKSMLNASKKASQTRSQSTPRMRLGGESSKSEFPQKKTIRSTSRPRARSSSEDNVQASSSSRPKVRGNSGERKNIDTVKTSEPVRKSPMRRRHSEDWDSKINDSDHGKGKRPKSRMKGRDKAGAQSEAPVSPISKGQTIAVDPEKTPVVGNKPKLTKRNSKKKLLESASDESEKEGESKTKKDGASNKPPLSPTAKASGTTGKSNAAKARKDAKKDESDPKPNMKKAFKRQNSGLLREIKETDKKGVKGKAKRKSYKQEAKTDGQGGFNFKVPIAEPKVIKVKPLYKAKNWKRYKTVTLDCLGDDYIIRETQRNKFGGRLDRAAEATGFFHVQKIEGRWSLIDPEGQLFYSVGLNGVGTHKDDKHFRESFASKYESSAAWANETKPFIFDKLGFNTMGCW